MCKYLIRCNYWNHYYFCSGVTADIIRAKATIYCVLTMYWALNSYIISIMILFIPPNNFMRQVPTIIPI